MAGGSATLPNANRAERQIQLVVNHDQAIRRIDFEILDQLAHRETAQVHEGLWLCQQDFVSCKLHLGSCRLAPAAGDVDFASLCDAVDGQKAEIVRRELVLDARIAETDNQFHSYF